MGSYAPRGKPPKHSLKHYVGLHANFPVNPTRIRGQEADSARHDQLEIPCKSFNGLTYVGNKTRGR